MGRWSVSWSPLLAALVVVAGWLPMPLADAQRVSDVRNTLHNLGSGGPGSTRASAGATTEVCVFCHTPHGASLTDGGICREEGRIASFR